MLFGVPLKMDNMKIKKIGRIQMICSQTIHFHEVTAAAVLTLRGKSKWLFTCRTIKVLLPLMDVKLKQLYKCSSFTELLINYRVEEYLIERSLIRIMSKFHFTSSVLFYCFLVIVQHSSSWTTVPSKIAIQKKMRDAKDSQECHKSFCMQNMLGLILLRHFFLTWNVESM